jgi:uncharacterized protein involved in exopolysaccharide biosynthesis
MAADLPPADPEVAIRELREQIADLEQRLAARDAVDAERSGELTGLRAQLAELTKPGPRKRRVDGFFEVDDDGNPLL